MNKYEMSNDARIREFQIKIDGLEMQLELLKMQLLNKDSQMHSREMVSLLDRMISPITERVGESV